VFEMPFLEEVALKKKEKHWGVVADRIRELKYMVDYLDHARMPRKIRSIEQIDTMIADLTPEFLKLKIAIESGVRFPKPPISAAEGIEPIQCERELVKEGNQQRNCVASYKNRILARDIYVYRIKQPERATLSIRRSFSGTWVFCDLKLSLNRPPSKITRSFVEDWLNSYNLGV